MVFNRLQKSVIHILWIHIVCCIWYVSSITTEFAISWRFPTSTKPLRNRSKVYKADDLKKIDAWFFVCNEFWNEIFFGCTFIIWVYMFIEVWNRRIKNRLFILMRNLNIFGNATEHKTGRIFLSFSRCCCQDYCISSGLQIVNMSETANT